MADTKLHLGIEAGEVLLKVALYDPQETKVVKTAILDTETNPLDDVSSFEAALQAWLSANEDIQVGSVGLTVSSGNCSCRPKRKMSGNMWNGIWERSSIRT